MTVSTLSPMLLVWKLTFWLAPGVYLYQTVRNGGGAVLARSSPVCERGLVGGADDGRVGRQRRGAGDVVVAGRGRRGRGGADDAEAGQRQAGGDGQQGWGAQWA